MTVSAIVLAAGLSTRMGARNKLLEDVGGRPLIRRVVDVVAQVTDRPPLVILGHEAADVADTLFEAPVRMMTNPRFSDGQQGSVAFGLAWADPADVTLVALGDQPLLRADDLRALIAANRQTGQGRITIPVRRDPSTTAEIRGNPLVLPAKRVREVLGQGRNLACRTFTERATHAVHRWETDRAGFFTDIDTPAELDAVRSLVAARQAAVPAPRPYALLRNT